MPGSYPRTPKRSSTTGGQHAFANIPAPQIQRSSFNRSCGFKTTFDAGDLIPMFCDEALPGDTMALSATLFARIATLLHPIMDNCYVDTQFFSVPVRLVWDNWQKFMGEQTDPGDSVDFLVPKCDAPASVGYANGSLQDQMGIPTKIADLTHNNLHMRAYNLIFNEWYRDQNLTDSLVVDKDDGPDDPTDYVIVKRGKRHDYFTSCLPFPQKGTAINLPLGTSAPLTLDSQGGFLAASAGTGVPNFDYTGGTNKPFRILDGTDDVLTELNASADSDVSWGTTVSLSTDISGALGTVDLTSATGSTINALRESFQFQKLLEKDARGGTRYTEVVRSHFGVVSPDQRLQRPEYLGGGSQPLFTQTVPASVGFTGQPPQGNLAAYGVAAGTNNKWRRSFTEHCLIIGIVSLRADLNYQQGLERQWSRQIREDFFFPALAHLGEQAVLNKEIWADGSATDELVFGYQERFAEYRYKPSRVSGTFRSNDAVSLDIWHLSQDFATLPVLDDTFIKENPPIDRVIAVDTEPHMLLDVFFDFKCARPMPLFSVPGLIDHF